MEKKIVAKDAILNISSEDSYYFNSETEGFSKEDYVEILPVTESIWESFGMGKIEFIKFLRYVTPTNSENGLGLVEAKLLAEYLNTFEKPKYPAQFLANIVTIANKIASKEYKVSEEGVYREIKEFIVPENM